MILDFDEEAWVLDNPRSCGTLKTKMCTFTSMEKAYEVRMQVLTEIKQAIQKGKYNVASRHATEFIRRAYFLQLKKDLFLGEVLESIYTQIYREVNTHEISKEDKDAFDELMVNNLDKLMDAYATNSDVYGALINMRYNATVFQYTTSIKYDFNPRRSRSGAIIK